MNKFYLLILLLFSSFKSFSQLINFNNKEVRILIVIDNAIQLNHQLVLVYIPDTSGNLTMGIANKDSTNKIKYYDEVNLLISINNKIYTITSDDIDDKGVFVIKNCIYPLNDNNRFNGFGLSIKKGENTGYFALNKLEILIH
jgi:hypothetical protein